MEPDNSDIYFSRGTAKQEQKNFNEALVDYNKTIELNPNHAMAHVNCGVILLLQRKDEAADKEFAIGFKLDPSLKTEYQEFITKTKKAHRKN